MKRGNSLCFTLPQIEREQRVTVSRLEPWPHVSARRLASSHGNAGFGAPSGARDATVGGLTAGGCEAADLEVRGRVRDGRWLGGFPAG